MLRTADRLAPAFTASRQPLRLLADALRLPSSPAHVRCLDGWRGMCILMLLAGHFFTVMGPVSRLAVEFFFVLSGRLMAEILIVRRQDLVVFAKRRAARIVPSVWFYCAVLSLGWLAAEIYGGAPGSWISPVATFLFVHNYLAPADVVPFLQHSWSLAVEEHCYVLLAVIALLTSRNRNNAATVAAILAGLAVLNGLRLSMVHEGPTQDLFWRSDVRAASVLISFAICLWVRPLLVASGRRWIALISPVCTVGAILCLTVPGGYGSLGLTACSILAGLAVNSIECSVPAFRRFFEQEALVSLGILSFSLYLWQQPLFMLFSVGIPLLPCIALTFVCALWNFKRVEWPARHYLNRRWSRASLAR